MPPATVAGDARDGRRCLAADGTTLVSATAAAAAARLLQLPASIAFYRCCARRRRIVSVCLSVCPSVCLRMRDRPHREQCVAHPPPMPPYFCTVSRVILLPVDVLQTNICKPRSRYAAVDYFSRTTQVSFLIFNFLRHFTVIIIMFEENVVAPVRRTPETRT